MTVSPVPTSSAWPVWVMSAPSVTGPPAAKADVSSLKVVTGAAAAVAVPVAPAMALASITAQAAARQRTPAASSDVRFRRRARSLVSRAGICGICCNPSGMRLPPMTAFKASVDFLELYTTNSTLVPRTTLALIHKTNDVGP